MEELIDKKFREEKRWVSTGNIFVRFFAYLPLWVATQFFWGLAWTHIEFMQKASEPIFFLLAFGVPLILPAFMETLVYIQRKKRGLSYFGNVSKQWREDAMDYLLRQRAEAEKRAGINSEDKNNIRYWHRLLKDGIISKSEFETKKKELLALK